MDPQLLGHKLLWQHKDPTSTRMYEFKVLIEDKYNQKFSKYEDLRRWSVTNLSDFWEQIWKFTQMQASTPFLEVEDSYSPLLSMHL